MPSILPSYLCSSDENEDVKSDPRYLSIRVKPRSSRTGIQLGNDEAIVVRVHAPAVGGAANRECLAVLAKALGVPRSALRIVRGERGREKLIAAEGMTTAEAQARLRRAAEKGAKA